MFRSVLLFLILSISLSARGESPFKVSASVTPTDDNALLTVSFVVPFNHYIYQHSIGIDFPENIQSETIDTGKAISKVDPIEGETVKLYPQDFKMKYLLKSVFTTNLVFTVNFQGCNAELCFMPESIPFSLPYKPLKTEKASKPLITKKDFKVSPNANFNITEITNQFKIIGSGAGYMNSAKFIDFLDKVESGKGDAKKSALNLLKKRGLFLYLIFIIIGGFLLNLTPCVLPMIPINLAIMGAGVQASSRKRGFGLGAIFGLGIAITYGALGVIVALTGSQFGTINSTPTFNYILAVVFVFLALAMFDIISIDLTKFQRPLAKKWTNKGTYFAAFILGSLTALMAGACVAPVVIQVLIISADFYAKGNYFGILFPFLLGLGMALPWPFAGASLSLLPKPGKWMKIVKNIFGIIIVLFALHYARIALKASDVIHAQTSESKNGLDFQHSLPQALAQSKLEDKPIFIDFWASWCKNCYTMDKMTFPDPQVQARLEKYILLKYQAEKPSQEPDKSLLDMLEVKGLPTYIILEPKK